MIKQCYKVSVFNVIPSCVICYIHIPVFYLMASFSFIVKYLGLLAMSKILQTHPKSVQTHKDLILQCLDDKDESIRFRALDLLYGMVSYHKLTNFVFLTLILLKHM